MGLFLLLGFPIFMAVVVFVSRQDRAGKIIFCLTSFIHLSATVCFWRGPRNVQFNPFLGFDALGQLVLNFISILFFAVSVYLIGHLKEKRKRSNRIFLGCLLCLLAAMTLVMAAVRVVLPWST